MSDHIPTHEPRTVAGLLDPTFERINRGEEADRIPFPLADLDRLAPNALTPGKLVVIAGHTGHGSTTLALDIARNTAVILGEPTYLATLTAPADDIAQRILAAQAGVPMVRIASGNLDDNDAARLSLAAADLKAAPLYISQERSVLNNAANGLEVKLAVVDGAHMMSVPEAAGRRLKTLALSSGICVVATVPLDGGYGRDLPFLDHFGDLHGFVANADMVLLTYRPDAVEREHPRAGEVDITIAKHRNGMVGTATACIQTHYSRILSFQQ